MWASKNGHTEIVKFLKEKGAQEFPIPKISEETPLFPVEIGGEWGYIDKAGKVVIAPQFDDALDFSEGLASVRIGWKWCYIDKTGKIVFKEE